MLPIAINASLKRRTVQTTFVARLTILCLVVVEFRDIVALVTEIILMVVFEGRVAGGTI